MKHYKETADYDEIGLVEITSEEYETLAVDHQTQGPYASDGPNYPEFMVVVVR